MRDLTHEVLTMPLDAKIAIIVVYALDLMHQRGILETIGYNISDEGKQVARLVLSDGFRPTDEQLDWALNGMNEHGKLENPPEYFRVLIREVLDPSGDFDEQFRRKTN